MKISKGEVICFIITAASYAAAVIFYRYLPDLVASHWNAAGEVNGYMPKFWGAFLLPFICTLLLALMVVVPRVDPKKENIEKFRADFDRFIILIFLFFAYVYALTIWANLGGVFNIGRALSPAFAILFYFIGVLIGKAKMNFSIGIRTPWTLSNEVVWTKTHRLGAVLFKVCGFLCLTGLIWPRFSFYVLIISVISAALISMVYSYIEFRRQTAKPQ